MAEVLISIKPEFVSMIVTGRKTAEIRTRRLGIPIGTRLWIYSTLPKGAIDTVARVKMVVSAKPQEIWDQHGREVGISHAAFFAYTERSSIISAIILEDVQRIDTPLSLWDLRGRLGGFHPPQSVRYLRRGSALLRLLADEFRAPPYRSLPPSYSETESEANQAELF